MWSFQIALRSRGLGSCTPRCTCFEAAKAAQVLGIPDNVTQVALIPVAYTLGTDFKPATRRPVEEVTYWDGMESSLTDAVSSNDAAFVAEIADALYALDGVEAVALGGSRAAGLERPDSDWDFGLYYRGAFDPQQVRDLGYDGYVSELGEWGGGLFNGGAWLRIQGRKVDVMFRDLDVVEHELAQARVGQFHREPWFSRWPACRPTSSWPSWR